jgi:hypothetical protein
MRDLIKIDKSHGIIRQGDVLLIPVKAIPTQATALPPDEPHRVILAHGEVTGHAHAVYKPKAVVKQRLDLPQAGQVDNQPAALTFLQVLETVNLGHEEHTAAPLSAPQYFTTIQTEYTPEELRNVAD